MDTGSDTIFNPFNVKDFLKVLDVDQIRSWQQHRSFPFSIAMMNDTRDFNFSSLVRNAVAFGASTVHLICDTKKWDRRGAVGAYNYIDIIWHPDESSFFDHIKTNGLSVVAIENNVDTLVPTFKYPSFPFQLHDPVIVFGAEGSGLSPSFISSCDAQYEISLPGCMRSLNVATTSGIVLAQLAQFYSIQDEGELQ